MLTRYISCSTFCHRVVKIDNIYKDFIEKRLPDNYPDEVTATLIINYQCWLF